MGVGDDIMFSGIAKNLDVRQTDGLIRPTLNGRPVWSSMWDNIDFLSNEHGTIVETKPNGKRWYVESWTDHIEYTDWKAIPGVLKFTDEEMEVAYSRIPDEPFIILNPDFKGTTSADNKDWGFEKYQPLTDMLTEEGRRVVQLVPVDDYTDVSGTVTPSQDKLSNAYIIRTESAREAFAILSLAELFVSGEGGMHHAAAALNIPGVVIFGGFISPDSTGYDCHVNISSGGEPCGTLYKSCPHCRDAMNDITPDMVMKAITV